MEAHLYEKKQRKKVVENMTTSESLGYLAFFFFSFLFFFIQPRSVELLKPECLYMTNTSQRPSTDRSHWVEPRWKRTAGRCEEECGSA